MKAVQLEKYNKDLKVKINDIPVPSIQADEVLIKVAYAAINPLEKLTITGAIKLIQDYPKPVTLGNELTGTIVEAGQTVKNLKAGDVVYTRLPITRIGAFAEYVVVKAEYVVPIPSNLDMKTATAAPLTGLTAYQALTEELEVEAGKTLFISGGSGSFGQMAVPLAKSMGLKVIISGNARSKETFLAKGVDQYIDYTQENYWEVLSDVDYVIDTLGPKEFEKELSIMKSGGKIVSLINAPNKAFAEKQGFSKFKTLLFTLAGQKFDRKAKAQGVEYRFIFVRADGQQLKAITDMVERENIIPAVDSRIFTVDEVDEALDYTFNQRTNGKVLIQFDTEDTL
ncbi:MULTISPECIES: NADP-dependent oxidoreductase [unclassified Staphylococcus]|uniref:NADP-dependent oxidoreductase n=1 Tax=unclassified Staphylococcus TaxID=91994 RepID=UPI0021CE057B|nr:MULTISPECIES: NADP-dependent oxidoreductase [unclassified Staphylococcus]UXR71666.1 NADP-dependent oxidoreductase [Staphylococcus sp. IVB6240]UXR76262.1 NADP-dependent oxidoreductase [Staphylococcus sp. IVB6233]UXR80460.1 NADP-dependent oxidoreductase [Staphylococcus sp. IVB6218]